MDTYPISSNSLEIYYGINGTQLAQQYKEHLSNFNQWEQKEHSTDWLLFPENMGEQLSIDETALSNGDLYTILTNKSAKGKKGALVAMIEGTESEKIIKVLKEIKESVRESVTEVTLDMAGSMNKIVRKCFTKASRVTDRFHVQKLAYDAIQEIRIAYRWDAINRENELMIEAKGLKKKYKAKLFDNGDTEKQLLARSRYLLFKSRNNWTEKQKARAKILFEEFPDLEKAYKLTHSLRQIYSNTKDKIVARTKLAHWYKDVEESGFKSFNTIAATIYTHYTSILNFFDNRSTNASAESFNAKLKAFRRTQRGVSDMKFFLFRIAKIFA